MGSERVPSRGAVADLAGAGLVILTSLQFGGVVVLGKIVTDSGLPIASFLAVRFAAAAALLALSLFLVRLPLRAARGEGWRLAVLGVAGYAVEATLFFSALRHGTAAAVTLLFFTYPVFVSMIAFLGGRGLPAWADDVVADELRRAGQEKRTSRAATTRPTVQKPAKGTRRTRPITPARIKAPAITSA